MSGYDPRAPRSPVVTDLSRQWAIEQKPDDWDNHAPDLPWEQHVAEQAERFERHYGDDRKPQTEWAGLWRRVWWPKADPAILHPKTAPQVKHPYVLRGHPKWQAALAAMKPIERAISEKCGVAQFRPDDPRARIIANG